MRTEEVLILGRNDMFETKKDKGILSITYVDFKISVEQIVENSIILFVDDDDQTKILKNKCGLAKTTKICDLKSGNFIHSFKDAHNKECVIKKSHIAPNEYIWFGVNDSQLTIHEKNTDNCVTTDLPKDWKVNSFMYLSRSQISKLLPILKNFYNTGDL